MNFFDRLKPYIIPYKKHVFLNVFFNLLYAVFSGLSFFLMIPLLGVIFKKEERILNKPILNDISEISTFVQEYIKYQASTMAESSGSSILTFVIIALILVFLFKNIFGYLANFNIVILREGVLKDVRNRAYSKILELPISFYSEKRKGDIMARIGGDVNTMQVTYLSILELIVREPLTIIVSLLIMFSTSVELTLFIFVFIPFAGLIISKIGKSLKQQSLKTQRENGYFLSLLEETLSGLKIIKGFNGENSFKDKFQASTNRLFKYSSSLQHRNNLASPVSEFLGITVFAVLLWYGGNLVMVEHSLQGEEFIGFLGLAYNILTPAKALSKASYNLKTGNAAAERVFEIIDTNTTLIDKKDALNKANFENNIVFDNISFKYEDTYVLNNLSLEISKGKIIALVGQSGSGKSTIANLVSRFYDVQKGSIHIDGVDIKDITKKSLRNLIGIVTQDAILFNDSIKNNMRIGKENATDEEVISALKIANAWEFVKELPEQINTIISENGENFSGGQKQRLSIARAVIKNPPIMILDEATSALDTESEKLVQIALENMMKNRTSIVIAHRLSTIQKADTIIVMSKGTIMEQGNHNELLAKQGGYYNLVQMQQL